MNFVVSDFHIKINLQFYTNQILTFCKITLFRLCNTKQTKKLFKII